MEVTALVVPHISTTWCSVASAKFGPLIVLYIYIYSGYTHFWGLFFFLEHTRAYFFLGSKSKKKNIQLVGKEPTFLVCCGLFFFLRVDYFGALSVARLYNIQCYDA
jgi:hypothetical protein